MRFRPPFRLLYLAGGIAASAASAEDVAWSWGLDATSNYVFAGVTQTNDGFAVQPWFDIEKNGFYFALWASTVELGTDNWEIDYYLGYRQTLANQLTWNASIARYTYDDTGDCCGEVILDLSYPVVANTTLLGHVAYNPETSDWHRFLDVSTSFGESISASARYGISDGMGTEYWDLGGSYQFTENVAADLRYFGANVGDAGLVATISLGF